MLSSPTVVLDPSLFVATHAYWPTSSTSTSWIFIMARPCLYQKLYFSFFVSSSTSSWYLSWKQLGLQTTAYTSFEVDIATIFFQTWRWQTRRNYNTSQCSPEGQHDKPSPPSECRTLAWLAEQRFGRLWPPSLLRCWANQADARQVRVSGYKRTNERTNEQTDRRIASSR